MIVDFVLFRTALSNIRRTEIAVVTHWMRVVDAHDDVRPVHPVVFPS